MDGVEGNAFAPKRVEDEIVYRPEGLLWEGGCAQTVLIAHHNQLEVQVLADEAKVAEHTFDKLQFVEGIYLLVGRLFDEGAVAIDEKESLSHMDDGYGWMAVSSVSSEIGGMVFADWRSFSCVSMEPYMK